MTVQDLIQSRINRIPVKTAYIITDKNRQVVVEIGLVQTQSDDRIMLKGEHGKRIVIKNILVTPKESVSPLAYGSSLGLLLYREGQGGGIIGGIFLWNVIGFFNYNPTEMILYDNTYELWILWSSLVTRGEVVIDYDVYQEVEV